jgi:hypothetical protein
MTLGRCPIDGKECDCIVPCRMPEQPMTLRNSSPQWTWNDETEEYVSRLYRDHPWHGGSSGLCRDTKWRVTQVLRNLGDKTDLNMAAAAVAAHRPR